MILVVLGSVLNVIDCGLNVALFDSGQSLLRLIALLRISSVLRRPFLIDQPLNVLQLRTLGWG